MTLRATLIRPGLVRKVKDGRATHLYPNQGANPVPCRDRPLVAHCGPGRGLGMGRGWERLPHLR